MSRYHELTWDERWTIEQDARRQAIATTELAILKMQRQLEREYLWGYLIGIGLALITQIFRPRESGERP